MLACLCVVVVLVAKAHSPTPKYAKKKQQQPQKNQPVEASSRFSTSSFIASCQQQSVGKLMLHLNEDRSIPSKPDRYDRRR